MTIVRHDDNDLGQNMVRKLKKGKRNSGARLIGTGELRGLSSQGSACGCAGSRMTGDEHSSMSAFWLRVSAYATEALHQKNDSRGRGLLLPWNLTRLVTTLVVLVHASSIGAYAAPLHQQQGSRDGGMHRFYARGVPKKTWIPIITIGVAAAVLILIFQSTRGSSLPHLDIRGRVANWSASNNGGPTELTAEQLAGSINNAGNSNQGTNNDAAGNATRPRRTRRTRRTPSQMSTHSLPAYAKEPGDQELVVFQGPQDLEDASAGQPQATVVNLDEDDADGRAESYRQPRYTPIPESPVHTPLLDDPSGDLSAQSSHSIVITSPDRGGRDTGNDYTEMVSLVRADSREPESVPHLQGEAPAYFEVVEHTNRAGAAFISRRSFIDAGPHNAPISPPTPVEMTHPPPALPDTTPQRRSGIRSLLHRMSVVGATAHTRNDSSTSATSSSPSHEHTRATSAGSALVLSPFRTLSRQKSIISHNSSRANLTSPSLISLNSISAPLTHTAVRTEFTYPKSGPTPEQIKLISSRESLMRFGVPYGPDAVAFAASVSRVDLSLAGETGERPPEFEDAVAAGDGVDTSAREPTGSDERQERSVDQANAGGVAIRSRPGSLDGLPVEREGTATDVGGVLALATAVTAAVAAGKEGGGGKVEKDESLGGTGQPVGVTEAFKTGAGQKIETTPSMEVAVAPNAPASPKAAAFSLPAEGLHPSSPPGSPTSSTSAPTPTKPTSPEPVIEALDPLSAVPPIPTNPTIQPSMTTEKSVKTSAPPPSSYHPGQLEQLQGGSVRRSKSRASQISYSSYTSYASDITYKTAAESLSSRRGSRSDMAGDTEDEDGVDEVYGDAEEDSGSDEEDSRPSTPTAGGRHGKESTDATVVPTTPKVNRQERHLSTMTITHA